MLASNVVMISEPFVIFSVAILLVVGLCAATLIYGSQVAALEKASVAKPKVNRKRRSIFR